jgi:hypothetical protein
MNGPTGYAVSGLAGVPDIHIEGTWLKHGLGDLLNKRRGLLGRSNFKISFGLAKVGPTKVGFANLGIR